MPKKGYKQTEEHKILISKSHKGLYKILTKSFLIKEYVKKGKAVLTIAKNIQCSADSIRYYLKKYSIPINKMSLEGRKNLSKANSGERNGMFGKNGELNPNYKDGKSPLAILMRNLLEYNQWRKQIFKRDNFTCRECGQYAGELEAHHIKPFKKLLSEFLKEYDQFSPIEDKETLLRIAMKWQLFWDIDNGKTLCEDCHKIMRIKYLKETLKEKD